ncbi:MAG TPA: medium chain dehydrogenase/reductase family protein [Polyangiaceae bacterium]
MKKIVVQRPGGFRRLKLEEHPEPLPGSGEVRIATRAVGVNFADCVVRMGLYKSAREFVGWPITPGFEFAGVVSAVGEGTGTFRIGEPVFGVTRFGAYATELVVHESLLFPVPANLTLAQAGSFSVAFLTAWYAVFELGAFRPGSAVLVHSAAGGVGSAVCQLARSAGARVCAVVGSQHKVDAAMRAGAHVVIDKRKQNLWAEAARFAPGGYQTIFDPNGPETLRQSYAHLAPMGRLVIYGFHTMLNHAGMPNPFKLLAGYLRTPRFNPLEMVDRNVTVSAFNLSYLFEKVELYRFAMRDLVNRLESGSIFPLDVQELPFPRAAEAHRLLQSGKTVGKLVLIP